MPFDFRSGFVCCSIKRPGVFTKSFSLAKSPDMHSLQEESKGHLFDSLAAVVDSVSGILPSRAADGQVDD